MGIDRSLLNEFVKITNDKKETKQTQLYGTVVTQGNSKYVKIDGSEIITPVRSTTDIKDDERVIVKIDNHMATITGNMTNPSVGNDRVEFTEGKIDRFDHLFAGNITAENIAANSITSDKILAGSITTDKLMAECIISDKIAADTIESKHIKSDVIESEHIKAGSIEAEHIKAGIIESDHISSGTITADKIATGTITAGSGVIADGAIGSAQISSLDVAKLESGTIDTSKIYIAGADGHLQLKGNRLQVFDGLGNRAVERVSVGDVNGDGSKFGLRVRGADGETILLDENGVTSEGITDGSITNNKISDDANIDGAKLNINSVVSKINEDGTETIQGTKIEVDGTTLNTKLYTITNKQTEDGERITQAQSQISANTNAIKLKVDEQTYTTDKKDMTSKLEKNTSEISAMKGQIALKVEQTDITNAISNINIGARNIFQGYSDEEIVLPAYQNTGSFKQFNNCLTINPAEYVGEQFTISFYAKSPNGTTQLQVYNSNGDPRYFYFNATLDTALGDTWKYYTYTFTNIDRSQFTAIYNRIEIYAPNQMGVLVKKIKIEKGNKATDWTPAPEDIDNNMDTKINSAKAEIKVTTDAISQNVSNLSQTVTNKADGSTVTAINNKVTLLETNVNGISGKVSSLEKTTTTLGGQVSNAQNTANTANNTANSNKTNITNLQGEVSTVKSNVSSLEVTTSGISQKVSSVESTTSTLTTKVNTAQSTADSAKTTANTANTQATTNKNNISTLTTTVNTTNNKVATLETNLSGITSRVSATESSLNTTTLLAKAMSNGKMLYTDPMFKKGINSVNVYNNSANGTVTVTRISKVSDCPTTSTHCIEVKTTGTASPGNGGFYQSIQSRANAIFIQKILAKVPTGCNLNVASNNMGDGYSDRWLTSNKGTGKWEEYIREVRCGSTGTFSTGGHVYVSGVSPTTSSPLVWYMGMCTAYDITDSDERITDLTSRVSTAESKLTKDSLTTTIGSHYTTSNDVNGIVTSKGYQTKSQVQQTVNGLQVKFQESGGYNLIYNGNFKKDLNNWNISGDTSKVLISSTLSCSSNQKGVRIEGTLKNAVWVYQSVPWDSNDPITLSYWQHTTATGSDGTTNPFRATQVVISYTDGTSSWHTNSGQSKYNTWEKISHTITPDSGKRVRSVQVDLWCRDTTKMVYYTNVMLEKGSLATEYTPNPNEIYAGITTIDKEGITVNQSNISTYTSMDASSFRVENNTGGTVAEFSQNSQIPNLTAGIINANEIYSPSICTKSPMSGSIKYIVNGSTGNDNNNGTTYSTPFKTVAKAVSMLNTQQDRSVDIEIYGSVTGFDVKGINGTGAIRFYFSDDAIVNGAVIIGGITNTIGFHGGSSDKATFKNGISIYRCRDVEIGSLTFRGTNSSGTNIYLEDVTFARIMSCDLGGLSTQLLCAVQARRSNLWIYNCRGSKITDVVAQSEFSIAYAPQAGTTNVPDYSNAFLCNYDGDARIHNWSGGNFVKTPSKGWNPAYTPTQKTQTWSFNKIWSDETLHGWSDRQELIQGYASTWNTGRWTGYMQMTDDFSEIRNTISGGTNLSGRIYVQRTSSSGNSTGSKLCLYGSDGTLITNSTSINRSQGVWVSLSSSIIQKIQSGAIRYFYLKADSNNKATYFKCERNCKIEITYTK